MVDPTYVLLLTARAQIYQCRRANLWPLCLPVLVTSITSYDCWSGGLPAADGAFIHLVLIGGTPVLVM